MRPTVSLASGQELIASSMRAHTRSAFDPSALDLDFFFAESPRSAGGLHA